MIFVVGWFTFLPLIGAELALLAYFVKRGIDKKKGTPKDWFPEDC